MFNEIEHRIALGRIESYIASRGSSVKYDSNTYYIDEELYIHAPKQYKFKSIKLLCALLHEAGHLSISNSILLDARASSKRNQAVVIEQEYLAWSKGLEIAHLLNIATSEFVKFYKKEWIRHWTSYLNANRELFKSLIVPYIERSRGECN